MSKIVRSATGMACQHCVRSVSAAVSDVPGVRTVEVDLASGTVTVQGDSPLSAELVEAALESTGHGVHHDSKGGSA